MNENTTAENFKHGYIQASNDNKNWVNLREINGQNTTAYVNQFDIETETPYHYWRLYFDSSFSTGGVSIQTITWEGWQAFPTDSETDYDFEETVESYIVDKERIDDLHFYKYDGTNIIPATINDFDFWRKEKQKFFVIPEPTEDDTTSPSTPTTPTLPETPETPTE